MIDDFSYGVIPFYFVGETPRFFFVKERWGKGHWTFPKGHPHEGESEEETALRELFEETRIAPVCLLEDHPVIHEYSFPYQERIINKRVKYFAGFIDEDELDVFLQEEEVVDSRWITLEDFLEVVFFPEMEKLVREAYRIVMEWKGNA